MHAVAEIVFRREGYMPCIERDRSAGVVESNKIFEQKISRQFYLRFSKLSVQSIGPAFSYTLVRLGRPSI